MILWDTGWYTKAWNWHHYLNMFLNLTISTMQPGFEFLHRSADTVCQANGCRGPSQKWDSASFRFPFCLHHHLSFATSPMEIAKFDFQRIGSLMAAANRKDNENVQRFQCSGIGRTETWRVLGPASLTVGGCLLQVVSLSFFYVSASGCWVLRLANHVTKKAIEAWPLPSLKCSISSILLSPLSLSHGLYYTPCFLLVWRWRPAAGTSGQLSSK